MSPTENVLIVEDDEDWAAIYRRAARREGIRNVRIAKSLAQAEELLREMAFGVAFVDIGLDVSDDRNIDGLQAMERVREIGDDTSMIVITGRSGRDVLPITRDAIKKYHAFDAIGKVPVELDELRRLMNAGIQEYERVAARSRPKVHDVFRGATPATLWDYSMLSALPFRGGINSLYELLERLFSGFLPVAVREPGYAVGLDGARSLAYGEFWSRARGHAVLVCFGDRDEVRVLMEDVSAGRMILGRVQPTELLNDRSAGSVRGVVLAIPEVPRGIFV